MSDQLISYANLTYIENNLKTLNDNIKVVYQGIEAVDSRVAAVDNHVNNVDSQVKALAQDFFRFVREQRLANRLGIAQTRVNDYKNELDSKFGHYKEVRNNATGILQATDLGVVRVDTIVRTAEEKMLATPNYWLTPCLIALAAWIDNNPELADKAVREAIRRNDEKTSLFFALVCRRAERNQAALKWTQRYLANQNEENLDRNAIIILDAFASGLLGSDSEGVIAKQMGEWLERLADKPGFVEQQTSQWSSAIELKRQPYNNAGGYTYLPQYSPTWPVLVDIMEGAELHAKILSYFIAIFDQQVSTASLKEQLDEVLDNLVKGFDDEELPLREKLKFEEFVVEYEGDEDRAKQSMSIEQTAFETHKDFTQLLTDAAMKPESSHSSASTQKFAIALSKDWITTAYKDVVARNRMKVPHQIDIVVDNFSDKTADGTNEAEVLQHFNAQVNQEKEKALSEIVLTTFGKYSLYIGIVLIVIGIIALIAGGGFLGIIAIVGGIAMIVYHFSQKKQVEQKREYVSNQFEQKRESGTKIIKATLAEVVDFRAEFAHKDAGSKNVLAFLEQISPEQYVRKLAGGNRRINVQ